MNDHTPENIEDGKRIDQLERQLVSLRELNAQQLAACDCAAMLDTAETHEGNKTVQRGNPFWSEAFESVMRRTAECIKLRAEVESLREDKARLVTALIIARQVLVDCQSWSEEGAPNTEEAVAAIDAARKANP